MNKSDGSVIVLVCDGHQGDGQDLNSLTALVTQLLPSASIRVIRSLCTHPRALAKVRRQLAGDVVVLSPCRTHLERRVPVAELRNAVRDSWTPLKRLVIIDPTSLVTRTAPQRDRLHAIALTAAAFSEETFAPALAPFEFAFDGIGRRELLTGRLRRPSPPVPQLADPACLASPRCHLCVDSCPTSALTLRDGIPSIDRSACTGCGSCVTACPIDAILLDSLPRHEWEAYLERVLTAAQQLDQPLGIWWICQHSESPSDLADDLAWLQLRLPCLTAATLAWVVQPLTAGAKGVAVTPCESCATWWAPEGPRSLLVQKLVGTPTLEPLPGSSMWRVVTPHRVSSRIKLREPAATADALIRLHVSNEQLIASPASPLGVVNCDADRCTSCGLCIEVCPTRALTARDAPDSWALAFAHSGCAACGGCVAVCPESTLTLCRGIEPTELKGSRDLIVTRVRRCDACSAALPPLVLVRRFAAAGVIIPDDRICGDCRSVGRRASRENLSCVGTTDIS